MNFTDNIFKRMDLKQIRSFVLNDSEDLICENDTYENRLKKGSDSIYKRLEKICPNQEELDQALYDLSEALLVYESVYAELGMKLGARMIFQLLCENDFNKSVKPH